MNATPPTGTEKPGPPMMGKGSISTSEKIIQLPNMNAIPAPAPIIPPVYSDNSHFLERQISHCFLCIVILCAIVFWLIFEVDRLARRAVALAVLAVALNCGMAAEPVLTGPAVAGNCPDLQKWLGQPFTGYHETFRWSRREWASLRDTITNKQGQVLDVRAEVLYLARRIGPYATNANVRNQIVRHQRSGEKARPWRLNPDGSPKWLDYQKFLSFAGKRIVLPSDGRITFDNWKEVKPGVECAEIVIGEGAWLMGYSDGETIRTQARLVAGQFAHACRWVGSSRVYFLTPE